MVIYDKICYRNALEIREKVLVMSIRLRFKHAQMNQTNQTNQSSDNVSTGFAGLKDWQDFGSAAIMRTL